MRNHRNDPGVNEGCVGVPVAAIFEHGEPGWDYSRFVHAAKEVMHASIEEWYDGGIVRGIVLQYPNRPPEVWADAHYRGYRWLYERFCRDVLGQRLVGRYFLTGYDVDHAYSRGAVPVGIPGLIRLFLVPRSANRSWGGYFERKLKNSFADEIRVGIRSETVAIRAKISGVRAPKLGRFRKNHDREIGCVVSELQRMGMVDASTCYADIASLKAFCNIVDGRARGMITRQFTDADGKVRVETENSTWL